MKIKSIKTWHEEIPLKIKFKHALASRATSSSIITKIELEDGSIGYGEALPRPYVTGETIETSITSIQKEIFPLLQQQDIKSSNELKDFILGLHDDSIIGKNLTAICAVELALIDSLAKSAKQSVYEYLGLDQKKSSINFSLIISAENEEKTIKYTKIAKRLWIKNLKLKVTDSLEDNQRALELIKKYYPKADIRVDANCAWNVDTVSLQLEMMKRYNISSCEQPLPKEDFEGLSKLVELFPSIHICVDESLCSFEDASNLVTKKSTTLFNIRLSKCGGIFNSLRIYNLAKKNGLNCQLGAQVGETAILSFFGRVFAAITGDLMFHEGSFGTNLLEEDVINHKYSFGCQGKASTKCSGFGNFLEINEKTIEKFKAN